MELTTERLLISELSGKDLSDIHQLHSLKETDKFNTLGTPDSIQMIENLLKEWIEQQKANPRVAYIFRIQLKKTNQFVGLMALTLGKLHFRIAEVWYKIQPAYWRQGYTTEALLMRELVCKERYFLLMEEQLDQFRVFLQKMNLFQNSDC